MIVGAFRVSDTSHLVPTLVSESWPISWFKYRLLHCITSTWLRLIAVPQSKFHQGRSIYIYVNFYILKLNLQEAVTRHLPKAYDAVHLNLEYEYYLQNLSKQRYFIHAALILRTRPLWTRSLWADIITPWVLGFINCSINLIVSFENGPWLFLLLHRNNIRFNFGPRSFLWGVIA